MISIQGYNICILDLLTDSKTGKLSASKCWQHIGFSAMTYSLLTTPMSAELILAYGAVVGGSHVAIMFLKMRYQDANKPAPDTDK